MFTYHSLLLHRYVAALLRSVSSYSSRIDLFPRDFTSVSCFFMFQKTGQGEPLDEVTFDLEQASMTEPIPEVGCYVAMASS